MSGADLGPTQALRLGDRCEATVEPLPDQRIGQAEGHNRIAPDSRPIIIQYPKFLTAPPFDSDYLARLRDGDAETERHFVSHFSNVIRISLRYRLRSWELIDDIRQETFLRVLK